MSIVEKLAYLKRTTGLTSEDIAQQSGVPLGTVNKIVSGQTQKPSCRALDQISRVFRVPIRYLIDDSVETDCCMGIYAEATGISLVTSHEWAVLEQYRALSNQDQSSVDALMVLLNGQATCTGPLNKRKPMICYQPNALEQRANSQPFKLMLVSLGPATAEADFAVLLMDDTMLPIHPAGTILAIKSGIVQNHQLGVFLLNRKVCFGKYHECKSGRKVESVNVSSKDILLSDQDEFKCLGIILGPIRDYDWIAR